MSIFNELLPKINAISYDIVKNFNDDLQAAFDCFDKFEEEFHNGRRKAREKASKDKNPMTTLQSIHEDEDESKKSSETVSTRRSSTKSTVDLTAGCSSLESNTDKPQRASKKRSKHEVDDMSSPEQDKRQKRNASVKAQSIISKQVNVNLSAKLRREDTEKASRGRRRKGDDKENSEPLLNIQIKQEKISVPPEPMDAEALSLEAETLVKKEVDDLAMPPPAAPVPKPRKAAAKEKPDESSEEESSGKKRSTRSRKQTNDSVAPPVPSARSTRASSRSTRQLDSEEVPPEPRPKRTRAKKKASEAPEPEKPAAPSESAPASPAEKPRPKRTRRGQKAAEKREEKPEEKPVEIAQPPIKSQAEKPEQKPEEVTPPPIISPKEERISHHDVSSPILQKEITKKGKKEPIVEVTRLKMDEIDAETMKVGNIGEMDKTVVIPNGVYNHAPVTPKNVRNMNETVVIEAANRETMVLDKPQNAIMDATVVLDKDPKAVNLTDDNSLLTDDSDTLEMQTPPKQAPPQIQPTSAVKEKVQQFEELASRVTRTKTRAMAKKEEQPENHTPPDKIVKPVLSAETLTKMNSMIFNGKPPQQISSSATKPRANIVTSTKTLIPSSTSKLSGINRAREAEELKREREDARKKKEAMLEAKRELQKKKREEKMAAAAAAREAAEKERRLALEAAARERQEKQAHADLGKLERLKEVERKKQELARKVAETEERRRAEEHARQQRLAEEQRRADEARRKQLEEAAAMKKEAAIMAKEIEKRQKEYIEKQKMKRMEDKSHTPLKSATPGGWHGSALSPVYMADGFQYLNSDEDEEPVDRPIPDWSTSKARKAQLVIQSEVQPSHVDRLFSVRVHYPDLRDIFPNIERARLKRTSSAVWRTPPRLPALSE